MTTIEDFENAAKETASAMSELILSIYRAFKEGRTEPQKAPEVVTAIRDVLTTVGEIPMIAPNGVEFAMRVFIHNDAADMSHVLNFPGNHMMPPRVPGDVDVAELIEQVANDRERDMLKAVGTWRTMSREEIKRYKSRMARLAAHREAEERAQRRH